MFDEHTFPFQLGFPNMHVSTTSPATTASTCSSSYSHNSQWQSSVQHSLSSLQHGSSGIISSPLQSASSNSSISSPTSDRNDQSARNVLPIAFLSGNDDTADTSSLNLATPHSEIASVLDNPTSAVPILSSIHRPCLEYIHHMHNRSQASIIKPKVITIQTTKLLSP